MAHHAYFVTGDRDRAASAARAFVEQELGRGETALDIRNLSFELFTVDDARRLISAASTSGTGDEKILIASMTRVFHEAQNALLKILEEPPAGATIILCVPSEGVFIPTLRSRLLPLPGEYQKADTGTGDDSAARFIAASPAEREKIAGKLIEQAKSDKDETKQRARREAIELVQGLTESVHQAFTQGKTAAAKAESRALLEDLAAFTPILYERSAPLKQMFEHLLLVLPGSLGDSRV